MKLSSALIAAGLLVEIATLYSSHPLTILAFLTVDADLQKVGKYARTRRVTHPRVPRGGPLLRGGHRLRSARGRRGLRIHDSPPGRLFVDLMPELGLKLPRD